MKNGDKTAYPEQCPQSAVGKVRGGLTKREYFAGLAMQGLLSNPSQIDTTQFKWIGKHAIGYADELLKQLES